MKRRAYMVPQLLAGVGVGDIIQLTENAGKHFVKILRLRKNDKVELFDGLGRSVFACLEEVGSPKHIFAKIIQMRSVLFSLCFCLGSYLN